VAHVHLTGALDTVACVERLRAQIAEAVDDDASLLLLEIDADRARPDILLALARAIEEAEMPTIGFLIDQHDRRVTAPCLALALLVADRVAIDPRTTVRFGRGDWEAELLPEDLEPEAAVEEFRMAVQRALASREVDPTLANAWIPDPEAPDGDPVEPRALGALGITAILAQTPAQVCRAVGHRGALPRAVEIETSLAPARDQTTRLLLEADDGVEQSRRALDLRNRRPDDREVTVHDHRRAGRDALDRLARAAAAVDEAEELLREYPEILLSAPPGRTDVGTTRQGLRSAWRYRLDDLREDIDYWRQRAQDSASR
jgi:hypothetical protein